MWTKIPFKIKIILMKYWLLTITKQYNKSDWKRNRLYVQCICDCGNTVERRMDWLNKWHNQSCGCIKKWEIEWLIWQRYWSITITWTHKNYRGDIMADYICDCWRVSKTASYNLDRIKSCWCQRQLVHWMHKTRAYRIRLTMKMRCENENHPQYYRSWYMGITYDPKRATFEWRWEDNKDRCSDDLYFTRIDVFWNFTLENTKRDTSFNVSKLDLFIDSI